MRNRSKDARFILNNLRGSRLWVCDMIVTSFTLTEFASIKKEVSHRRILLRYSLLPIPLTPSSSLPTVKVYFEILSMKTTLNNHQLLVFLQQVFIDGLEVPADTFGSVLLLSQVDEDILLKYVIKGQLIVSMTMLIQKQEVFRHDPDLKFV